MTQSIDSDTRRRAQNQPLSDSDTHRRPGVVTVARWFFAVMMFAALGCLLAAVAHGGLECVIAAATFAVLALLAGVVIAIDMLMADRREFYQRGQLDGWIRGWRGQEPEVGDPLLH